MTDHHESPSLDDLQPRRSIMASQANIFVAGVMILAPLAGFAAAAGRVFLKLKRAAKEEDAS